jgi:hypothetical protein
MIMLDKIFNIDKNPKIIKFAQTFLGKLIIISIFALCIKSIGSYVNLWFQTVIIVVSVSSFIPRYRHLWIFIGMLFLLQQNIFENQHLINFTSHKIILINILVTILLSEMLIFLMRRYKKITLFQYPITLSYVFVVTLILIASYSSLPKTEILYLWSFISIYNHYFWFVGYTFLESRIVKSRDFLLDYGRYLPIWGFTALPFGKGSVYLSKVESQTSEDLAVTQLKGLKLSYWAFILSLVVYAMQRVGKYFQIPSLNTALYDYSQGLYYSFSWAWLCLLNRFFTEILMLTVMGHAFIATCRMCGFRVLRNTYKPLQSKTIAEFWNRYNFYFKELLAEFFFYPAYFRFFSKWPKTRMFFATLSAAGFGNILFHFLLIVPVMMSFGFGIACRGFIPYVCYALVLGVSIGCSQLYNLSRRHDNKNKFMQCVISPVFVLGFYSILGLFNQTYQTESILINLKFLGSLFNIRW